jgi:hypothetical protein
MAAKKRGRRKGKFGGARESSGRLDSGLTNHA